MIVGREPALPDAGKPNVRPAPCDPPLTARRVREILTANGLGEPLTEAAAGITVHCDGAVQTTPDHEIPVRLSNPPHSPGGDLPPIPTPTPIGG